ncbi:MAG: GHKL domain-containing protein [Bacteroidetes bacterium]|nr:GHKL domain-containing protein [Bacteroidota bacterium]
MKFNRFYINIFLRVILIVLFCIFFVFFLNREDSILTMIFVAFLILMQTIYLIKYVNRTNKDLAEFLIHLQQEDTSAAFSKENITNTFKGLGGSFDKINAGFKKIKSEKTQKEHYLNYVIDNVKVGLVAFDNEWNIEFINNQAKIYLNNLEEEFLEVFSKAPDSESKIIKRIVKDELLYLAFSSSEFKIDGKQIKLFTIHDVKNEIESTEVKSWQKLTSVLTHEMMNSITPITSLAHAIKRYLKPGKVLLSQVEVNDELISDIFENADIIQNRSKGLLEFINNYRTISKLPKPKFEKIDLTVFIQSIIPLFNKEINEKEVEILIDVNPGNLSIIADKGMIEQVIINLLKNSIESFSNNTQAKIKIKARVNKNDKIIISVIDNGKGIEPAIMDDIFVPFYTTKNNGSGIGLSLSRQIMRLHHGTITVNSILDKETIFSLVF